MGTSEIVLGSPPAEPRRRELWLQHAAGFIIFEDVRARAIASVDPGLDKVARDAALLAIDETIYRLMMVIDGVSGRLRNQDYDVDLRATVRLTRRTPETGAIEQELDLREGDGMCMGFHGWVVGDFGEDPVVHLVD